MQRVRFLLLFAILLLLPLRPGQAAADPFSSGRPSSVAAATAAPGVFADVVAAAARIQRDLNEVISRRIRELNETRSAKTTISIVLLSFAFGVFHAIGPGHGKMVVASYFVARRERWLSSVIFGSLISLIQGASAVAVVGALAVILRWTQFQVLGQVAIVEVVSYGLVALLGLWMLYQALAGYAHAHHHAHSGDPRAHVHSGQSLDKRTGPALILAAGLMPCASAIIVLLFALANGVFAIGVLAAVAMSAGMATTVSTIGVLSVLGRSVAERMFAGRAFWAAGLERALNITGPLLIVGFSTLLMLGAWSQL
jgi:nickel/cobalt transporter (NicO) family protein